jgi:broad specificity phosphatase PhoE
VLPLVAQIVAKCISEPPLLVVSSPLQRARETAEFVAKHVGYEKVVRTAGELREVSFGIWEGKSLAEVSNDPQAAAAWENLDPTQEWPGAGEDLAGRANVAGRYIDGLMAMKGSGDIVIVSHGLLIQALLSVWLVKDVRRARLFDLRPGSVSVLRHNHATREFLVEALGISPDLVLG